MFLRISDLKYTGGFHSFKGHLKTSLEIQDSDPWIEAGSMIDKSSFLNITITLISNSTWYFKISKCRILWTIILVMETLVLEKDSWLSLSNSDIRLIAVGVYLHRGGSEALNALVFKNLYQHVLRQWNSQKSITLCYSVKYIGFLVCLCTLWML